MPFRIGHQPSLLIFQKQRFRIQGKQIEDKRAYNRYRLYFATKDVIKWVDIQGALPIQIRAIL